MISVYPRPPKTVKQSPVLDQVIGEKVITNSTSKMASKKVFKTGKFLPISRQGIWPLLTASLRDYHRLSKGNHPLKSHGPIPNHRHPHQTLGVQHAPKGKASSGMAEYPYKKGAFRF